jgi:acetyl-CoA carboxylase beta subunit
VHYSPEYSSPGLGHESPNSADGTKKCPHRACHCFSRRFLENTYICLKDHHFLEIAYKRQRFYLRDTEFFREVEVSSELKYKEIKEANKTVMRLRAIGSNIGAMA